MGRDQQVCAFQQGAQGRASFFEGGSGQGRAGDQEQVGSGCEVWEDALHGGAQESFGAITSHRVTDCSSRRDADAGAGLVAGLGYQHNKRVGIRLSKTPHPLEIG